MTTTALNLLPRLIDAPGVYVTRNGYTVLVHTVKDNGGGETTRFAAVGTIKKLVKVRYRSINNIWHISGRVSVFEEKGLDIIKKVKG